MKHGVHIACITLALGGCGGAGATDAGATGSVGAAVSSAGGEAGTGARGTAQDDGPMPPPVVAAPTPPPAEYTVVANPRARHLVGIAVPSAHDEDISEHHRRHARGHAARTLAALPDVEVAPPDHGPADMAQVANARGISSYFLECALLSHTVDPQGTHIAVSVVVIDARTEDVVATLQGRATAPGPGSVDQDELALEGALDSALRGLTRFLATRR